jgi:hypothetical protein
MNIEIIIGIIGIIIAIASYLHSKKPQEIKLPQPIEEINNLKIQFKVNQKLSIEIQEMLKNYIEKYQASDKLLFENITFSGYLNLVQSDYEECLSERVYNNLSEPIYTRANIESMNTSLQTQCNNLMAVKNMLKTLN